MKNNDKIAAYVELLMKWNEKINLIGKSTLADVWQRHIEDSLQIAQYVSRETKAIIDLGSGGGLPAIPLAIQTGLPVNMIESDKRKSAFLRQALRSLEIKGCVYDSRIEETNLTNIAEPVIITARAVSELKNILEWVNSLVAKNNLNDYALLLLKGANVSRETIEAQKKWQIDFECFESKTATGAVVMRINKFGEKNG